MKRKLIVAMTLTACAWTGDLCAQVAAPAQPTPPTPKELAEQITPFAAGYCKAMQDKQGVDFSACVQQVTDMVIAKMQARAEQHARKAKPMTSSAGQM